MQPGTDLYYRLGVSQSASKEEIQRAYRKLAMQHHPDRGGDPEAFKQIEEAGRVLLDDEQRAAYDETGCLPGQQSIEDRVRAMLSDVLVFGVTKAGESFKQAWARAERELRSQKEQGEARLDTMKKQLASLERQVSAISKRYNRPQKVVESLLQVAATKLQAEIVKMESDLEFLSSALTEVGSSQNSDPYAAYRNPSQFPRF